MGMVVSLQYMAYVEGQEAFDYQQIIDDPFVFRLGSEGLLPALQSALCEMRKGDQSRISITGEHAFTPDNIDKFRKEVIGHPVLYEMTLLDFYSLDKRDPFIDRLQLATNRKDKGNQLLRKGDLQGATKKYKKAISFLYLDESVWAIRLKVAASNNLALCA